MVWKNLRNLTQLKRYLGAFFVFSMALQTVMIVAAYFGEQEISWSGQEKTMGLIIMPCGVHAYNQAARASGLRQSPGN